MLLFSSETQSPLVRRGKVGLVSPLEHPPFVVDSEAVFLRCDGVARSVCKTQGSQNYRTLTFKGVMEIH